MRRLVAALAAAILVQAAAVATAGTLVLDGQFAQGALLRGRTDPGTRLVLDGRPVPVAPSGAFIIGFGRDAPGEAVLEATFPDGRGERRVLAIAPRTYDIQRVDGLPPSTVTPDPKQLQRIRDEAARVAAVRAVDTRTEHFAKPLAWPAIGPITGVYGSQRILNGEPRQPHFGIDIAAPRGTPVVAAQAGTVTLAEDLFLTGWTVIIDHGYGLNSTYSHLDSVRVRAGQTVAQGEPIGTLGASGRATGPHLDWRLNWYDVRLDPALAIGPMPEGR